MHTNRSHFAGGGRGSHSRRLLEVCFETMVLFSKNYLHKSILSFFCLFFLSSDFSFAQCPKECNGHGICGADALCKCFKGWGKIDCSALVCPSGNSWASKALPSNYAHSLVECSDAGKCNEENGVCECDEGYWGLACERMICPGLCSGHGKCMTISSLGKYYTRSSKDAVAYTNWDKHKVMGCVCDYGFHGPNCGFKYCPKGDDIMTSGQVDYQFRIAISSTSVMSGTVRLEFHGSTTSWNANADSESDATCKAFMERLGSLKTVTCSRTVTDASTKSSTYTVTVNAWPFPIPHQNNIFYHDGNPPISDFVCITSDVVSSSSVSCSVVLLSDASNHKEYVSCSRRGKCTGAGDCNCIDRVGGIACDAAPVSSEVTCNEADMTVHDTCSTLTGTVINIVTTKIPTFDFQFLGAIAGGETVFQARGDGFIDIKRGGLVVVQGGETVMVGGLQIPVGGASVHGGGLYVDEIGATLKNLDETLPALTVHATASGASFVGDALVVKTTRASNSAFNLWKLASASETMFTVSGTGHTKIHKGGFDIKSGGGSIVSGGLHCYEGTTIHSSGLQIDTVGATITNTGLQVIDGGSSVQTTGQTASALSLLATHSSFNGSALLVKARRMGISLFDVIDARSNNVQRMKVSGEGVMTLSNGNEVLTGGMTVAAGGMDVKDGATIYTGGLNVVAAGATITAGGLVVDEDAMTVKSAHTSVPTFISSQLATGTNTGLKIESARAGNAAFKFLKLSSTAEKFSVYGNGDVAALSTADSTSAITGSIRMSGGLGISKQLYAGGVFSVQATEQSTSFNTGALTVAGGLGVAHDLYVGGIVVVHTGSNFQPHSLTGETRLRSYSDTATDATTLNVQRTRGSAGSRTALHNGDRLGELQFGGYVGDGSGGGSYLIGAEVRTQVENSGTPVSTNQMGSKMVFSTVASGGNTLIDRVEIDMAQTMKVLATTDSTSHSSGSVRTNGGMFVSKSLYTGGSLYCITTDSATSSVTDVGVIGHGVDDASASAAGIGAGIQLGAESASGNIEIGSIDFTLTSISDGAENSDAQIRLVTGGTVVDVLSVSGIRTNVHPTTPSTSALTGSAQVQGGIGVAKSIYTSGQLVSKIVDANAGITEAMHLRHTSSESVGDGIGVGVSFQVEDEGNVQEAGSIDFVYLDATNKHSQANVKLVSGGSAAANVISVIGSSGLDIFPTTASTSSTTGALVVNGGVGVAKSVYNGGQLVGTVTDTSNSAVTNVLVLKHSASNTVANNIGAGIQTGIESAGGGLKAAASIAFKLNDKTHASSVSQFEIRTIDSGTALGSTNAAFISTAALSSITANMVSSGTFNGNGDITIGNAASDTTTWTGTVQGASPFVFEGSTRNAITTTLAIETLSADQAVNLPNAAGTVITTGNRNQIVRTGTLPDLTVTGALTMNQNTNLGNAADDTIAVGAYIQQVSGVSLNFQGASNAYKTTLAIGTPLGASRQLTLPDAQGTAISQGNLNDITEFGTLVDLTVVGNTNFQANSVLGDAEGDVIKFESTIQNAAALIFEGSTTDAHETTLAIIDPTADNTVTLPGVTGTIITNGNQQDITSTGSLTSLTGNIANLNGNIALTDSGGNSRLTISGKVHDFDSRALLFEGTTDNVAITKLGVDTATSSSKTIKVPDASGTIITTGNLQHITAFGTMDALTVSGSTLLNGNVFVGSDSADVITFTGKFQGLTPFVFEASAGGSRTSLAMENVPDSATANANIKFPDATGTVITQGNLNDIVVTGTLTGLSVTGATTFQNTVVVGNSAAADVMQIKGTVQGTTPLVFDGATADGHLTNIAIVGPTSSSKIVTLPAATGTVITTTNQGQVTSAGSIGALAMSGAATLNGDVNIGNAASDQLTINSLILGQYPLIFAGGNNGDSHVTKLQILTPTAHRTVTLPNACGGTIITTSNTNQITHLPSMTAIDVAATGTSTFSGSTSTFSGQTSYLGAFTGAAPIAFEGKVEFSNPKHLTLGITDPTQDNLIVIPNVDGTIITTANYADVVSTGTRDTVVVTGATALSGANEFGDAATDTIDIGGTFQSSLALDGPDGGTYLQTISVVSLDGSEQTLTLPDASGNVITTGNMNAITQMGTLSSLTLSNSLTAGQLDVGDSAVTQSTSATTSVSVSTSVGRITTVSLTNANANEASACSYFYVTPANVGWSTTSVPIVNVIDYSGTTGIPSAFVASRTTSNFYLGVCNAHPTASLDGAVTIGYSFV